MVNSTDLDTLPWYRQFWPWFLIFLPGSVVVAGLTTVYIASEGADDLVVDDYYKDGLGINRQLEKKDLAVSQGISAELEFSQHSVVASLKGPVAADVLYLLLSHPLEADRDFSIELVRMDTGFYGGVLPGAINARWHWTLENRQTPGWRLDGTVDIDPPVQD